MEYAVILADIKITFSNVIFSAKVNSTYYCIINISNSKINYSRILMYHKTH